MSTNNFFIFRIIHTILTFSWTSCIHELFCLISRPNSFSCALHTLCPGSMVTLNFRYLIILHIIDHNSTSSERISFGIIFTVNAANIIMVSAFWFWGCDSSVHAHFGIGWKEACSLTKRWIFSLVSKSDLDNCSVTQIHYIFDFSIESYVEPSSVLTIHFDIFFLAF